MHTTTTPPASSSVPVTHPLLVELRERRKQFSMRLLEVVEEARHIKEHVNPTVLALYEQHFRHLEIALQRKTLASAELTRREELFRLKLERGEKLSAKMIEVVNTMVDREFARVHKRLREAFDMDGHEREREAKRRVKNAESEGEVVRMYREVVKRLHPDVSQQTAAPQQAPQAQQHGSDFDKFWHNAQEAYKTRNASQLKTIYELVCLTEERQDFHDMESAEVYLRNEISRLARRLKSEEDKLRNVKTSEPYTLKDCIQEQQWRDEETKRFEQELAAKERDIERAKTFLQSINAGSWHDAPASKDHEDGRLFNDDFLENTYFSNR